MATGYSSSIDSSVINNSKNSCSEKDIVNIHDETNKRRITLQTCFELSDEILEIRQIEYEQRLLLEEINLIDVEKQRLQDLLNLLQWTKSNTKSHHRRLKRTDSNSPFQ